MLPKSVLVTGAFGTVGSAVVKDLVNENAKKPANERVKITCISRPSKHSKATHAQLLKDLGSKDAFNTVWVDLLDADGVAKAVQGQDAIIHLAAVIPPITYDDPEAARKINVGATKILLEACEKQAKPPRFVYGSSYSVWGCRNPNRSLPLLTAETPVDPQDAYASQKVKAESLVRKYKGEWTILRIGAVANHPLELLRYRNRHSPLMKVLTYSIPADQRRHGVHYADAGRGFAECALTDKPVAGKVLCLGGDATWKVKAEEYGGAIQEALGVGKLPENCYRKPAPDTDNLFYYEDWMDTTETQALLSFQNHTFDDYKKELRAEFASARRVMRLLGPLVRRSLRINSPHYRYNRKGVSDPDASKSMAQLLKTGPEPLDS